MKIDTSKLIVKKLSLNEIDAFVEFATFVKAKMKHPEWIGDVSKAFFVKSINNNASIYVWTFMENINKELTKGDQFIASGIMSPAKRTEPSRLGQADLKYKEVIILGPEMVNPEYIGNGLQMDVIDYLEIIAKGQGYKYALGIVDLDNVYALRNLLKKDFEIASKININDETRLIVRNKF